MQIKWETVLSVLLLLLFLSPSAYAEDEAFGLCPTLLKAVTDNGDRLGDTELGCLAADAIREAASADAALFPAGMLGINMEAGPITSETLAACYPQDAEIYIARVRLAALKDILEACTAGLVYDVENEMLSVSESDVHLFPQVSGFLVSFDTPALAYNRVWSITLDNQARTRDFSGDTHLTLAYPSTLLENEDFPRPENTAATSLTVHEALARYITAHGATLPMESSSSRVTLLGAGHNSLIGDIPPLFWGIFAGIVLVFSGAKYRKKTHTR